MKKHTLLGGKLEVKFADTETATGSFDGYGAVFGNTDQAYDIIAPGAFAKAIATHKEAGSMPAMFFNHDSFAMPVGKWEGMEEDEYGLKMSGYFLDTTAGRDTYAAVKAGAVTGLSIGYFPVEFTIENGIRTLTEVKLLEVSVVTFPCNTSARVANVKSAETDEDFIAKLIEIGVDEEDAKALAAKRAKSDDESEDEEAKSEDEDQENSEADDADEEEKSNEDEEADNEKSNDEDESGETKYNERSALAAIKTLVATIKEYNVR